MHTQSNEADLYAYRRMTIDEYFAGEIEAEEMRILLAQDPELDLMFKEEIVTLERKEDLARMYVMGYAAIALILYVIAAGLIAAWVAP
jgi:helix-turn-helix protein